VRGGLTAARSKRTTQAPGRPRTVHEQRPGPRGSGDPSSTRRVSAEARAAGRRRPFFRLESPPPGGNAGALGFFRGPATAVRDDQTNCSLGHDDPPSSTTWSGCSRQIPPRSRLSGKSKAGALVISTTEVVA
jgi:hypothetical protein